MNNRGILFVMSGPSGVGKGTVARVLKQRNENITESVSATTRAPREGETHGKEYFFITKQQFEKGIEKGAFIEYSAHFENYYGTPREYVEQMLQTKDVLLEIDVNGGLSVKEIYPEAVLIMIAPPKMEDLKKRLEGRNTETAEKIALRLERAEFELALSSKYDYVVVNDVPESAAMRIEQILKQEKNKRNQNR